MKRNQPITITSNEQKVLVDQNEALKKEIFEFYKLCKNNRVKVPNLNESVYILEICKKIEKAIEKTYRKNLKGQNVLIIGGSGFIGSHLAEELIEKSKRLVIVDNLSVGKKIT